MATDLRELARALFKTADNLRTNPSLGPDEYARPVLALLALRQMEARFDAVHAELGSRKGRLAPRPEDDQARGAPCLPESARFSRLLALPGNADLGAALSAAIQAVADANPDLAGVLPTEYAGLPSSVLAELLRLLAPLDILNLVTSQTGFAPTQCCGGGALLLDARPWLGGACLGCPVLKPHMAMCMPVALLAGGRWRTMAGAPAGGGALILASLAAFGIGPWRAFVAALPLFGYATEQPSDPRQGAQRICRDSPAGRSRLAGGGHAGRLRRRGGGDPGRRRPPTPAPKRPRGGLGAVQAALHPLIGSITACFASACPCCGWRGEHWRTAGGRGRKSGLAWPTCCRWRRGCCS
jgi:hypothetical protein